jgi:hypothetical protein
VAKGCGKLSYDAYSKPERRSSLFAGDVWNDDTGDGTSFLRENVPEFNVE